MQFSSTLDINNHSLVNATSMKPAQQSNWMRLLSKVIVAAIASLFRLIMRPATIIASIICVISMISLPSYAASSSGKAYIDIEQISNEIFNHVQQNLPAFAKGDNVEIKVNRLSPSLKLAECKNNLELKKQGHKASYIGKNTIKVSCDSPRWSFFSGASVTIYQDYIVTNRPVAKGEIISDDMIEISRKSISKVSGNALTDASKIIGQAAKRPIRAGSLLTTSQFHQPQLIKRGDALTIKAIGKTLSVRAPGEALTNGRLGQNIRVRNLKSNREIVARVKDRETVVVMLN